MRKNKKKFFSMKNFFEKNVVHSKKSRNFALSF